MLEEPFKGYQLKGFAFQAHLDFSEDVFQNRACKCNVRGKLQRLLPISSSDGWPLLLYYPLILLGGLTSLCTVLPDLLRRIFPSISDSCLGSLLFWDRLASPGVTVWLQQTGLYKPHYSVLVDRQTDRWSVRI